MKTDTTLRQFLTAISLVIVLSTSGYGASAPPSVPAPPTVPAPPGYGGVTLNVMSGAGAQTADAEIRIDFKSGPERLGNLVDYIRDRMPKANIIMGPGVADTMVNELNLHAVDLPGIMQAFQVASDFRVDCRVLSGSWAIRLSGRPPERQVEAFNLSGYLQQLGSNDDKTVNAGVDQIERIILETVAVLMKGSSKPEEMPVFRFHRGANLVVVIGTPEAIDVARKVVSALPGQQPSVVVRAAGVPPAPPAVPQPPSPPGYDKLTPVR